MIMLDTHVLLWWVAGDRARLSSAAADAIAAETQNESVMVSAISALEIAQLVKRGRLQLSADVAVWLAVVQTIRTLVFIPIDTEIAVKSVELPGSFHKDLADRVIVATARRYAVPLVTADKLIRNYAHVRAIW